MIRHGAGGGVRGGAFAARPLGEAGFAGAGRVTRPENGGFAGDRGTGTARNPLFDRSGFARLRKGRFRRDRKLERPGTPPFRPFQIRAPRKRAFSERSKTGTARDPPFSTVPDSRASEKGGFARDRKRERPGPPLFSTAPDSRASERGGSEEIENRNGPEPPFRCLRRFAWVAGNEMRFMTMLFLGRNWSRTRQCPGAGRDFKNRWAGACPSGAEPEVWQWRRPLVSG